ncbi:MAG: hypothetical protein OXU62_04140 [Gammaproteobacteria bacterium]|nr:hypothetical protein [Gammaproteobacteria bacterium]
MATERKPQYWVVGASWGGVDDQAPRFVENSMWMLGHGDGPQVKLAEQMKPGDRIAIKKMMGRGQSTIRITHVGIIKGVVTDASNVICSVDWVACNLDREVEAKGRGSFQSVLGPLSHGPWVEKVFCL